jgi:adenine/guanine phosphoribosyltransferase-like PRPP-binding protein
MIDEYLGGENWDEPPAEMALEMPYGDILDETVGLVSEILAGTEQAAAARAAAALRLYVRVPALVNVALNYKICTEHGLPLHPTIYYELAEARRYKMDHSMAQLDRANRLHLSSIELARAAYRLDEDYPERAAEFKSSLPEEIPRFIYTGGIDKYSWRGAEPAKLHALAAKIRSSYTPTLIVAAAHGAIMPALLLAEYLSLPLYFIRFSMFKRKDEAPILSVSDEVWLSSWRDKSVLLFDEDVAKGTTLDLFTRRLEPLFAEVKSACSIRHAGSSFAPDFVARYWWD